MKRYFIPDAFFWEVLKGFLKRPSRARLISTIHNSPLHWWIVALTLKRGTKSILFGVHQFLWHPFTIWRAWRYLYKRNPTAYELIAIFCHDLGYWGKPYMDSPEGQTHPEGGATIAMHLAYWLARVRGRSRDTATVIGIRVYRLSLFHSTHYAQKKNAPVSALYLPDKVCILFDPKWFYLLRGKWSGEVYEYAGRENAQRGTDMTVEDWLYFYRKAIKQKADAYLNDMIWKILQQSHRDHRLTDRE